MLEHENVKIHFLPPNTTSLIQPMDQGAISIFKTNFKYLLLEAAIEFSTNNTKTLMDFLKKIDLLDAINWVDKAWSQVTQSALKGVWNKLLLSRSSKTFEIDINEKVDKIVHLGQDLGLEDIDTESVIASLNEASEALSDEDLVELDNELQFIEKAKNKNVKENVNNECENVQSPGLNKETVSQIIQRLAEASDVASELDPNYERAQVFRNSVKEVLKPYQELFKLKSQKVKQQQISKFLSKDSSENVGSEKQVESENVDIEPNNISNSRIASLFSKQSEKSKPNN